MIWKFHILKYGDLDKKKSVSIVYILLHTIFWYISALFASSYISYICAFSHFENFMIVKWLYLCTGVIADKVIQSATKY